MATSSGTTVATAKKSHPINALIAQQHTEIAKALPAHMSPEHFARVVTTAVRTTPKLAECEPSSILASVMLAAQLGLEPGTFGHCYLIPFKGACTFQIGYRGLLDLVRRSGEIQTVMAVPVAMRDRFEIRHGTDPGITHHMELDGERGGCRGVYAVATFKSGGYQFEWMSKDAIDAHRRHHSKSGAGGPWDTSWEEMAKKTVLKRLCKYLPMSVDIARRVDQDGKSKLAIATDMLLSQQGEDDVRDAEVVDTETVASDSS